MGNTGESHTIHPATDSYSNRAKTGKVFTEFIGKIRRLHFLSFAVRFREPSDLLQYF